MLNQLFKGEIYANMSKLSSNLSAFRINLINKHTNPYGFINFKLPSELVRALPKINSRHHWESNMPRGYCLVTPGHLFVPWGHLFVLLLK